MVPNRALQSPAPQWEILQATDSSEVEDGRYDVPPHRVAPKPALKRKESDRLVQTSNAKRPRVEESSRSTNQPDVSRTVSRGHAADGVLPASATLAAGSPKAPTERLQHVKKHASVNKLRSGIDLGTTSISVPGSSASVPQPLSKVRPAKPPSFTQSPTRPRLQIKPVSIKSASHAPPPADAEIIDISSGDEAPAPRTQPSKKPKRLVLNNAFKKRLGKPQSASAPVQAKKKSPPEVIEILDSDEEEETRKKEGTSGTASTSIKVAGSTSATTSTFAKEKTRATGSSDASMASGTDMPGPLPQPRTAANAKGKEKAPVASSDSDSDASMAYAPAPASTSRPSSRSDVLPPPSTETPVSALTPASVPTTTPILLSHAHATAEESKMEHATPHRHSLSTSTSALVSKPSPVSSTIPPPASTSTSAATTTPPSVSIPESPRYTPVVKKPILGTRAPITTANSSSGVGSGSPKRYYVPVRRSQALQGQKQLAVKSTTSSRPPVSVSVPLARKTQGKRDLIEADSEDESRENSGSSSGPQPQPPHSLSRTGNARLDGGPGHLLSLSGSASARTASDADLEPDTRGLSDALGLSHQQEILSASHTDSDRSSGKSGKGKEKEVLIKRPPLPGRGSATHSRTASASSAVLRTVTTAGRASPLIPVASPVASAPSITAFQAPGPPGTSRVAGASVSTTTSTPPKSRVNNHSPKSPKERKAATPGDSDELRPEESEGLSSDAGYETEIRGSQFIVNKLAQLRKEKSAGSIPIASATPTVAHPSSQPSEEQLTTSPPPISPTPPLQTSSASTSAERSPLPAPVIPRASLPEARTQAAPSQSAVAPAVAESAAKVSRTEVQRVPLPNKHRHLQPITSHDRHSYPAVTSSANQQRTVNPLLNIEIRSPGNKPIWPPPPSEPVSPTSQEPTAEALDVSGDVIMITDDETDNIGATAGEASESDGGGLFEAEQDEEVDHSDDAELQEIEQVQHEVVEMSQSLAAASLSESALVEDGDEEIPPVEDRGEGSSRRTTRSSSASSGMHEQMPSTPSSYENIHALVETVSDGYDNSAEDIAAASASRQPRGKTYGGFPVLTWKEYRKNLHNFTPECLYAADIPHGLHDHINRLTPHTRLLPAMRAVYEAMIQENTASDEPDAPPVRIQNPVDEEATPAWEFYYTNKIYHGAGVPPPDIKSLVSCGCRGPCNPKSTTCACVNRQREAYGNQVKMNFAYDKAGNLVHPGYPIYECNDLCGCGDECMNRVVQHGRKVGVAIRKTANKGWGIFATQKIASGQFIGIYSGELLTDHEAHERGIKYNKWGKTYLFDIDFHHLKDPDDQNWTNKFTVDAYHCGNFTRFLNHSCNPNSRLYPCYINEGNIQKPLLAIFSRRVIEADEEICFNYQGNYPGDDDDDNEDEEPPLTEQEAQERDLIYEKCMCGAKNCTGVMFK